MDFNILFLFFTAHPRNVYCPLATLYRCHQMTTGQVLTYAFCDWMYYKPHSVAHLCYIHRCPSAHNSRSLHVPLARDLELIPMYPCSVSRGGFGCSNTPLCVTTPPLPSREKDTLLYSIVGDGRYHKLCRFSGVSRGAKVPLFSLASLVQRVEAAVAHCAVKYCGCCKMCSGRRASLTLGVSVTRR